MLKHCCWMTSENQQELKNLFFFSYQKILWLSQKNKRQNRFGHSPFSAGDVFDYIKFYWLCMSNKESQG